MGCSVYLTLLNKILYGPIVNAMSNLNDAIDPSREIARPNDISLDIYNHVSYSGSSKFREELMALTRWVVWCEEQSKKHLKKARAFRFFNRLFSSLSTVCSGMAGMGSALTESGLGEFDIAVSILSFIALITTTVNVSILASGEKYRMHMDSESDYKNLASSIAVTLAKYDTEETHLGDFIDPSHALSFYHVDIQHLNDVSPDA